jgi:hypothetical protein
MINEITIEGIVTREPWSYDKDVFFRIASYRDMDLPAKPDTSTPGRDEPDYVNIRYPGGAGTMFSVQKGQRVRVNGFLQSREFKESLVDLVEKAKKNNGHIEIKLPEDSGLEKVAIERNTTEVVATRVISLDIQPKKKTRDLISKS